MKTLKTLAAIAAIAGLLSACTSPKTESDESTPTPASESSGHAGHQGAGAATTEKTVALPNEKCPVMGGAAKADVFTEYKGKKVHFCCPGCEGKFLADPAAYGY